MKYNKGNKGNKGSIKKDDEKDNFLINLGKTLKNTAGFAVETANNFGTNLPFDLLRDFGVPIKETVFTPTAYNKKDYINMSVKDFIPNLLKGSANLVTGILTDGLVNKGVSQGSNFVSNKLKLLNKSVQNADKINKPHWLKGYKEIKIPNNFKSEINWGKWNKEIPNNKSLMDEYLQIEKTAKANGTWMKNPDGTDFPGLPEQFVQQNSKNFKKAFPNPILDKNGNIQINYHGTKAKNLKKFRTSNELKGWFGDGTYTTPDREYALGYTRGMGDEDKVLELYINSNNPQKTIENPFKGNFKESELTLQPNYDYFKISQEQVTPFSNLLKSMKGNNGMFNMTNPNIYKSAIGLLGGSQLINNSNNKERYTKGLSQYKIGGKLNNYTNINMKFNKEKTKKFASGGKTPKAYPGTTRPDTSYVRLDEERFKSKDIIKL